MKVPIAYLLLSLFASGHKHHCYLFLLCCVSLAVPTASDASTKVVTTYWSILLTEPLQNIQAIIRHSSTTDTFAQNVTIVSQSSSDPLQRKRKFVESNGIHYLSVIGNHSNRCYLSTI